MRRGTPQAELLGELLVVLRTAGTGRSMRYVGERIGSAAGTVSQIEKGERALKEPKIAAWADALGVTEADLRELWLLCQGWVPVGSGPPVFYADQPETLRVERHHPGVDRALKDRPELKPLYELAERIAEVLNRLRPAERFQVDPYVEPPHIDKVIEGVTLTESELVEQEAALKRLGLPVIISYGDPFPEKYGVHVPLLQERTPIVRRRGKTVRAADIEDLIRDLSGPERERVRGYIEAIIEQRGRPG